MTKAEKTSPVKWVKKHKGRFGAYMGLLFCIVFFSILTPLHGESIWSVSKMTTLLSDVIVLAILSVGAVFVYALGNMDISIGKQVGLYATLIVIIGNATGSLLPGILLSLAISVGIGFVNGATGELLKIHPMIASVVVMMVLGGINSIMYTRLGSRNVALQSIDHHIFKQPWLMLAVLIVEIAVICYLFYFTKFGKNAKAIGANRVAAQQSGISLLKYQIIPYLIMGVFIVIAALFQMGYTGSSSDSTGTGFEMNVVVALVLGGMPLSGGMRARVICAIVGSLTLALLTLGLPMIGMAANQVFVVKALIFLAVVLITCRKKDGPLPR